MFKKLFHITLSILFLLFSINCTLSNSFAAENLSAAKQDFGTSYNVTYDVGEDGVTTVSEKITLKNLTSQYYASSFKLIIGATQISDIKASDDGGLMEVNSKQENSSTVINVKFNQQVVGLGKSLSWTLQFKSRDFAEKIGKVWEVRAPKVSTSTNLESYNLTISVPLSFGEPTLISPIPRSQVTSNGKVLLSFEKPQLISSGVSANFGNIQLFNFDLAYHLENNNLVSILTNIALPPDTAFQDILFQKIDPKPLNVTLDDDGNYLAWYRLSRGQRVDVRVLGSSRLYTDSKVKNPVLSDSLRKKYTQSDKYWEKDNPEISAKLAEILGNNPKLEPLKKVELIYRYVVNNLKYDSTRLNDDNLERLGAVTVLNNPTQAVCMEFSDLFIALARAAGIPARELDGYAYTSNSILRPLSLSKDILHAWPQYWDDKKGWIMVDPTWENTTGGVDYFSKFDLSHLVFAIKGSSSTQPIAAGSYKYFGVDSKDVAVMLSDVDFLGGPKLDVNLDIANPLLAGFPGKLKVTVRNTGNSVLSSRDLVLKSSKLLIVGGDKQRLGDIPAFGSAAFDINIRTKSLFDSYSDQIIAQLGTEKFIKDIAIKPFFAFAVVPIMIAAMIFAISAIYLAVLGFHFYQARGNKKKNG